MVMLLFLDIVWNTSEYYVNTIVLYFMTYMVQCHVTSDILTVLPMYYCINVFT